MKPFLSGRPTSSTPPLQAVTPPSSRPATASVAGHSHGTRPPLPGQGDASPTVECVKQGDKVVRLVVTCSCGERIEIDCLYPGMG